jgi:hypothetical protein
VEDIPSRKIEIEKWSLSMPDMPDSGVDESQVENNENIEKYRPSSILLKKVFRES